MMRIRFNHFYLIFMAFLWLSPSCNPAVAQETGQESCLPALQPTILDFSHSTQERLVLFDRLSSSNTSNNNTDVGAAYESYKFDYSSSKRVASSLSRLLQVDYKHDESENIFLSTLSDSAVRAYIACKESQRSDISYSFAGDIVGSSTFFIKINWHPSFRPDGEQQDGSVVITQGKFIKSNSNELSFKIKPTDSTLVAVERDEFKRSQIAIVISGKVALVNLPPRSRYRILTEIVKSSKRVSVDASQGLGDLGSELCVELNNEDRDAAIIPGTFVVHYDKKSFFRADVADNLLRENERLACSYVKAQFLSPFSSFISVDAYAQAMIFRAVPVPGAT